MTPRAYYNEYEPSAAAWLRELIRRGLIAPGDVDTRSIEDVRPDDLRNYTQCHFFAGIGVWSYALRRAGWSDDRPVWTGSCPCQPFSTAGKGLAFADERHLWPAFYHLIGERRPPIILGEQVASAPVDDWIDLVHADLEALGYAFGSVPFPAAGVGAPHIRDRNYWAGSTANTNRARLPRTIRCGTVEETHVASAWRSIERIHAEGTWQTWVSESGAGALVDGAPARVGRLRGYGNAINAEAARVFIEAMMDSLGIERHSRALGGAETQTLIEKATA